MLFCRLTKPRHSQLDTTSELDAHLRGHLCVSSTATSSHQIPFTQRLCTAEWNQKEPQRFIQKDLVTFILKGWQKVIQIANCGNNQRNLTRKDGCDL